MDSIDIRELDIPNVKTRLGLYKGKPDMAGAGDPALEIQFQVRAAIPVSPGQTPDDDLSYVLYLIGVLAPLQFSNDFPHFFLIHDSEIAPLLLRLQAARS